MHSRELSVAEFADMLRALGAERIVVSSEKVFCADGYMSGFNQHDLSGNFAGTASGYWSMKIRVGTPPLSDPMEK